MRVVIAGGAGALGRRLATDFEGAGHDVVILTRSPKSDLRFRQALWDGRAVGDWASELEGAIVVNLAGELVDRRPTATNIELLRRSRVEPTAALAAASRACGVPPRLWLQMSTLAIYGDAGNDVIDETHPPADGPPQMAGVATAWEAATKAVVADRIVRLRTGVVLDNDTPAFNRLTRLARWGLGGRLGPGDQWVSWIHIDDFLASVRFLLDAQAVDGVVHVTSPNPVRNRDMMTELRRAVHRPWSPPMPTPLVHVGAVLLRTDPGLALTGRRCIPNVLDDAGFEFTHERFAGALDHLLTHAGTDRGSAKHRPAGALSG